jgi:acetyl esterase/lipase
MIDSVFLMRSTILALLLASAALAQMPRGMEIPLWPEGAPGAEDAPDVSEPSDDPALPKKFTVVHHPSIYVFLPPKEKANGVGVVVAPGGGHSQLVIDKEGWEVANWLNQHGIAAFVLKYRLARAPKSHYTVARDAWADASQAMRIVRKQAADWNVDPKRIGIMGFSAGGEVAALMETHFDAETRPDFAVVVYPGFQPGAITVPKNAPETFLVCADDDPTHVVTTVNLYLDLQKQGVSSEMHIYASGKHGFGLRAPAKMPVSTWTDRLWEWMGDRGLVK